MVPTEFNRVYSFATDTLPVLLNQEYLIILYTVHSFFGEPCDASLASSASSSLTKMCIIGRLGAWAYFIL